MDHFRVCTDRHKAHLTLIRDSELQSDPKHTFMSRRGGPGSWVYAPYIFSSLPVKKQMLLTLESREIQLHPKPEQGTEIQTKASDERHCSEKQTCS